VADLMSIFWKVTVKNIRKCFMGKELIDEILQDFFNFKPRILCNCKNFKPKERDYNYLWVKCGNCSGWKKDKWLQYPLPKKKIVND